MVSSVLFELGVNAFLSEQASYQAASKARLQTLEEWGEVQGASPAVSWGDSLEGQNFNPVRGRKQDLTVDGKDYRNGTNLPVPTPKSRFHHPSFTNP